jgi:hypothetical protein
LARSGEYFCGQQAAQLADVALGVDAVRQLAKAHVDLPADRLPVAAGRAELRGLRALVAIGTRDAERGYARVSEGEDDVARRDLAHGLVEGIAGFVSVALGLSEVAAGYFGGIALALVDPSVANANAGLATATDCAPPQGEF